MRVLGISSMFHDASVAVVEDSNIVFAGHAERYSRVKNDRFLNRKLIQDALQFGKPDAIAYHEIAWLKKLRLVRAGNWDALKEPTQQQWVKDYYPELANIPSVQYLHHETHAAAGVLTSKFDECAVIVIDAIGEFDTASIWHWKSGKLKKKHSIRFPSSLGLFYSAATHYVGLKPNEDEYILMGMAAYGNKTKAEQLANIMSHRYFKHQYPHTNPREAIAGKGNLQRGFVPGELEGFDEFTVARAAQQVVEERLLAYARYAHNEIDTDNLVFMGGVALNCVANSLLFELFDNVHIMPNPGDAGSSLGAAALHYYNLTAKRVEWTGPYLGYQIPGEYPVDKALRSLERNEIFGIANGRAEFGPRALGNRSLLADPRGGDIKHRMNAIKQRQQFRPFAPVILEEHVHNYFDMPTPDSSSPYMQFVARCRHPDLFPAIIHADGTSRVQTVNKQQHPGLYTLLEKFYKKTGCPMLVNTSLNIKGEPIVNTVKDAEDFERHYGITVHTRD